MLFGAGLISVLGSESIGLGGAGPLAVVTAAFVSCYSWTQQGWEVEEVSAEISKAAFSASSVQLFGPGTRHTVIF